MPKPRLATQKTTAALKKNRLKKRNINGEPRKWSDAWWAEYWNYQYEKVLRNITKLDYHLRMAEGSYVNEKPEKVIEHLSSARKLYKGDIHRGQIDSIRYAQEATVVDSDADKGVEE